MEKNYEKLMEDYKALEKSYISLRELYECNACEYRLNEKQYMFVWEKIKPFMNGKPDINRFYRVLGGILDKISDAEQRKAVMREILVFLQILNSAENLGVEV